MADAYDISPALLEAIRAGFTENLSKSPHAAALLASLDAGTAGYAEAGEYACETGQALADAFAAHLGSAALPDGRMYWNIAERVVAPLLREDHALVSDYVARVQAALNRAAGLGLKAQTAPLDEDRVNGILNKVSEAARYDDVAWVLDEPVKNFSQAVADQTLRRNVEFQGKAGLRPKVVRRAESGACKWCRALAGSYDYPDVPDAVYQRHESCRCTVEYDPGSGRRQNVHSKQWTEPEAELERRRKAEGIIPAPASGAVRRKSPAAKM